MNGEQGLTSLDGRLGGRKTETLRVKFTPCFSWWLFTNYVHYILFSSTVAVLTGTGGTALRVVVAVLTKTALVSLVARLTRTGPPKALDGFSGLRQLAGGENVRCHSSAGAATTADCCYCYWNDLLPV